MEQAAVSSLKKDVLKTMMHPTSLRMVFRSLDPSNNHSHLPAILTSSTDKGIGGGKEQEGSKNGILHLFAVVDENLKLCAELLAWCRVS
jgi:hypothetical protein